jgi:hypothetical protein
MEKTNEIQIHIRLLDEQNACETTMHGNHDMLSSLVYSAMISHPKFAEIILHATVNYVAQTSRQAMLN